MPETVGRSRRQSGNPAEESGRQDYSGAFRTGRRRILSGAPAIPSPQSPMKLPSFFNEVLQTVDVALDKLLPFETTPPVSIHKAMRYSVFAGGKRVRPILCIETARIFSSDVSAALYPGCAIEFIHTYSL